MELGAAGFWALVIVLLFNTLFIIGIAIALWQVQRRLGELERRLPPLIDRTTAILADVERLTHEAHQRAERILDRTTEVVDTVARRVDTASAIAEETVSQPLIGAASVMAGVGRALRTYREQSEKGDSR